ncbi:MAG: hypothetical protein LIP12_07295 [Clostridiales bacterium]|nr:hypothetical protein [Clostridiales bacterium]
MKLNREKHIGRVLFIVEGSRTEFAILRRIFCNLLGYSYIEKRRNRPDYFISSQDRFSQVVVINTRESNIRDISENETYLDDVFDVLREQYQFPVDQSAIYYLFDRDPESNTDSVLIENYISVLANPYDNKDGYKAGQLLLSYPSIESYTISNFKDVKLLRFSLGKDAKTYIGTNTDIQLNKISEETVVKAAQAFLDYLESGHMELDIDDFSSTSHAVFMKQETEYLAGEGFRLFSMLTLAFLQMGILEMEEEP